MSDDRFDTNALALGALLLGRYRDLAAYNGWANRRIYRASAQLSPAEYREDRGAFFRSVHGTLNHILVADRIWMARFSGVHPAGGQLDAIVAEELDTLAQSRALEDERILAFMARLDVARLLGEINYANSSGMVFAQPLAYALDHFFNHQTHHRGQVHALLSHFLGNGTTPSLDLIAFQRETGAGGTHTT